MKEPMEISMEKKESSPFTIDEVKNKLSAMDDLERELYEKNLSSSNIISEIIRIRQSGLEYFLSEKDRFNKVFQTSNGSWYFQIMDGYSLRVKNIPDGMEFGEGEGYHPKFQPIMCNTFFISSKEHERTEHTKEYPGESIMVEEYKLGVMPLELNIYGFGARLVFEKKGDHLNLIGTDWGDGKIDTGGNMVGGIHVGHPITKIEK